MATPVMSPPPIATDALRIISENYLLEKFRNRSESKDCQSIDKVEEIDMIQALFKNSSDLFKMYGSPEEFVDNLKIYRNFTTSYKYFETKHAIPFYTTPIVYMSLKGGIFMAKADFYVLLENIALRNLHPKSNSNSHEVGVYTSFLALFIKIKAKDVNRKLEFVRFDKKEIDDIENEFVMGMELSDGPSSTTDLSFHGQKLPGGTMKQFNEKMREYLPGVADDDILFQRLESANGSYEKEERPLRLAQLMYELETMRSCLNGIINKRPHLFHRKSKKTQPSSPIVVRMFEDGDRQFVMNGEFLKAIDLDVNYSPKDVCEVLDMKDVLEKYKDHVDRIEFIRTPILRSKHKAVPIRLIDSLEFCVLAVDGLFEVLKELILGLKLFQHVEEWPKAIFKQIHTVFDPKVNNPYFINLSVLTKLKKSINENCLAPASPPPDIRDVNSFRFTIRNLRKELKFLGLVKHFPEISDYAEIVYKEVMKCRKESKLRTCDMFDAVEKYQLRCIFDRVPELKAFVHSQKSCSRVIGLKCDTCNGAVRGLGEMDNNLMTVYDAKMDAMCQKVSDSLPIEMRRMPENIMKYRHFAMHLLNGQVLEKLKKFTGRLLARPTTMVKNRATFQRQAVMLLNELMDKKVSSRAAMIKQWRKNDEWLLREYLQWVPGSLHHTICHMWPPLEDEEIAVMRRKNNGY